MGGIVTFTQQNESSPTTITYEITGNDPNALRGMHIHQFGDNTNGCTSAGPHFNPFNKNHGGPTDSERHVGDLGNFETDGQGTAKGSIVDNQIKLIGPDSILGVRFLETPFRSERKNNIDGRSSVPLLFTATLMILVREVTRTR